MAEKPRTKAFKADGQSLTRREVLVGAAGAALVVSATSVAAAPRQFRTNSQLPNSIVPIRRYMAAATVLGDGRVLVSGGFDRPWDGGDAPPALKSVIIYDPVTGGTSVAAPMRLPRARHAAVTLRDGRAAVLGGFGLRPTSSIEVYDPFSNTWRTVGSLSQPRYDHTAVYDGNTIYVMGGSGLTMLSGVEVVYPGGDVWS